ncbi:hypothetical protein [Mycolicibacterium fortuitum]|nr:hypothetical protein [Mycolicibacterium fortuitum]
MSETTLVAGPFRSTTSTSADTYVVVTQQIGEDEQETAVTADEMIVDGDDLFAVRDGKRIAGFRNWSRYGRLVQDEGGNARRSRDDVDLQLVAETWRDAPAGTKIGALMAKFQRSKATVERYKGRAVAEGFLGKDE